MSQEEDFLKKRLRDLAGQSYRGSHYTYTSFLSVPEQELYYQIEGEIGEVRASFFGGAPGCERQVLRFGDEESLGYEQGFPICCIEIVPLMAKFSDRLTHRDYLGALMNLGIERDTIGDIMIKGQTSYVFCLEKVADYIVEHLGRIKHTSVACRVLAEMPEAVVYERETVRLVVPSMRMDVVIAKLYHLSRSQSIGLFQAGKVFVNGRQAGNNSAVLREGDIVSVRGYGKFDCDGVSGETRKGNLNLRILKYI